MSGPSNLFQEKSPEPALTIDNNPLTFVSSANILCIKIQNDLRWDEQVGDMQNKTNCRLYMLRILKKFGFIKGGLSVVYKGYVRPL